MYIHTVEITCNYAIIITGSGDAIHSQKKTGHVLWFKFNEGYSNAVRRPIKMKDLL